MMRQELDKLISDTVTYLHQEKLLPKKKPKPTPMLEKMEKHLPHVELSEAPQGVVILLTSDEDLPFLKNLARAIQDRICPVKILRENTTQDLSSFTLILSQKKIELNHVLLKRAEEYEKSPEEKKKLWGQICQLLKSS